MFRSYLIAAGAALLCTTAAAQQKLDPSRMYPITTPVKNAGTVDVTTGKWTKPAQGTKAGIGIIFNNTCTWTTQAYYAGFDWCEENYDEGRIPSSDPAGSPPPGALDLNTILSVQVSYCTFSGPLLPGPGYDMDVAFFDTMGGDCVGGAPPTPPAVATHPLLSAGGYLPLSGLGLPGSTTFGFQACWLVTLDTSNAGLVIQGDGDQVFTNDPTNDKFTWMQRQNNSVGALQIPGTPDGFFISGEPLTGGYGACSYNIPCGTDAITGLTCGTGLDTFDASWINVDGIGVGASTTPAGCANSVAQYGFGTNCYFFGGHPAAPLASYWLVLEGDARPSCFTAYCTQTKLTSVPACFATLSVTDCSATTGVWSSTNIPAAAAATVVGIYIYTDGVGIGQSAFSATVPFGTLCLAGFKRSSPTCAPAVLAASAGCNTGTMNVAVGCNGGALGIVAGEDVNVQLWHRDPPAPGTANFSNAIFYTVQ